MLTVLVRESAQNSWDARADQEVEFRLDLGTVSALKTAAWRELLGAGMPAAEPADFPLRAVLRQPTITYLAISDRGTVGLGGPTQADVSTSPGENRNWLSFVLNSGEKQDTDGGGGTYGYGKGAFYLTSRVGTILIYTRFRDDAGDLRSRLIGSSLMTSYTLQDTPYTGRHFWGLPTQEHCEPLIDDDADQAASALGLPGFRSGRTGTTVVIVDPDLADPRVPEEQATQMGLTEAGALLADAVAWNLWPIMLRDRSARMDVRVTAHGLDVPVLDESNDATLHAFAAAYRRATGESGEPSMCHRPKRRLGSFGEENTFGATANSFAAKELGLDGSPHHFAVMRIPDLIVSYYDGPAKEHPDAGYAGVFKVADELDPVFAQAEPPTHDAWIDTQLKGHDATYVRVSRLRLREKTAELAGARISRAKVQDLAAGSLSQRLGYLMSGPGAAGVVSGAPLRSNGSAAGVAPGDERLGERIPPTGPMPAAEPVPATGSVPTGDISPRTPVAESPYEPATRTRSPVLIGDPTYVLLRDRHVVRQRVLLGAGTYRGRCRVVTGDGKHESEHPVGAAVPTVFAWRDSDAIVHGDTLVSSQAGEVDLLIDPVADVVFDIDVEVVR